MATISTSGNTTAHALDPISSSLLHFIKVYLDDNGAWEWNLRFVGVVSALVLTAIRLVFHKAYGVDWFSLANAIVTGFGALAIVYLNVFASEAMTGLSEPLRTAQCEPALTSLHRIVPAIAMGYAVIDIIDGFTVGIDFLIHGILTLAVMLFFCEQNRPQIVAPFIIMECSTIFLNFVRATFLDEVGSLIVQFLFAITFTVIRIIIVPPLHFGITRALFMAETSDCDAPYMKWVVLLFGMMFNTLNAFWFYKLVRKVRRKLSGKEKIKDKLSLASTTKRD